METITTLDGIIWALESAKEGVILDIKVDAGNVLFKVDAPKVIENIQLLEGHNG